MSMSDRNDRDRNDRDRGRTERERPSADRDRRSIRETLEDDLDLIRGAPRDRAMHILRILLEAVYGDGFIRATEELRPQQQRGQSTGMTTTDSGD